MEVDGFKNLLDFTAEFGPFTCIAGENGAGKSNVFDAIEFLSLLADRPLTILAARREMQSWRRLALEPSALRAADRYTGPREIGSDGSHLAAALYRAAVDSGDPEAVYSRVAGRLASLAGVDVWRVWVDTDDARELLTVQMEDSKGIVRPARSLSEGTLRVLALCVMLEDPPIQGVLCMEEAENGIHPANRAAMVELVQDLAMDPHMAPGRDNPLRQVLINTHSPVLVRLINPKDLLYASPVPQRRPDGVERRTLRLRPLKDT